jgi:hypothetical protein
MLCFHIFQLYIKLVVAVGLVLWLPTCLWP